jgi:predicted RNA-binding protein
MSSWKEQLEKQARSLIREIAALERHLDPEGPSSSLDGLYGTLERIYTGDLPLADLRDRSDLIFRLKGEAFNDAPKLQLITSIFENVSNRVTDLTKVILGKWADGRVSPSSLDLSLSGMARGSLLFGLSADVDTKGASPLLRDRDTLFVSTREALSAIDLVAHVIEDNQDEVELEQVSERIDDPRVRDAALLAVQRLSPSGRRGIETLAISGQEERPALLTSEHRRAIRESLVKPVIHGEEIQLSGYVREIDLDAHRFELRGVDDEQIRDVRCAYRSLPGVRARDLLGSYVRVDGLVERTADGVPRLLSVLRIDIRKRAPEDMYLIDDGGPHLPLLKE